jgi:hypothetical protein
MLGPDAVDLEASQPDASPSDNDLTLKAVRDPFDPLEALPEGLSGSEVSLNLDCTFPPASEEIFTTQKTGIDTVECAPLVTPCPEPAQASSRVQATTAPTALSALNSNPEGNGPTSQARHHYHNPPGHRRSPLSHQHRAAARESPLQQAHYSPAPWAPQSGNTDTVLVTPPPAVLTIEIGRGGSTDIENDQGVPSLAKQWLQSQKLQGISRLLPVRMSAVNQTRLGRTTSSVAAATRALGFAPQLLRSFNSDRSVTRGNSLQRQPALQPFAGLTPGASPSMNGTEILCHSQMGELPPPEVVAAEILRAVCLFFFNMQ